MATTQHPKIMRFLSEPKTLEDAEKMTQSLTKEIDEASANDLKQMLKQFIPEYQPALDS